MDQCHERLTLFESRHYEVFQISHLTLKVLLSLKWLPSDCRISLIKCRKVVIYPGSGCSKLDEDNLALV